MPNAIKVITHQGVLDTLTSDSAPNALYLEKTGALKSLNIINRCTLNVNSVRKQREKVGKEEKRKSITLLRAKKEKSLKKQPNMKN